jgi:DNA-binding transcriptional LysR family regulator
LDRLEELATFVRIIEEGSLIGAARRLRRSPPAVTRALAALEDRTGQRLVDRTTRRLAVTEAGLALFERARILLNDYDAATLRTPEAPVRGLLRITAPVQFGRRSAGDRQFSGSRDRSFVKTFGDPSGRYPKQCVNRAGAIMSPS